MYLKLYHFFHDNINLKFRHSSSVIIRPFLNFLTMDTLEFCISFQMLYLSFLLLGTQSYCCILINLSCTVRRGQISETFFKNRQLFVDKYT